MAKYRSLTAVELEALKDEFIKFLVLNGISAQDWISIRDNQFDKTSRLIDSFSDVIFEDIVKKVRFLEFFDKAGLKIFKCDETQITLIGLENISTKNIDFNKTDLLLEEMKAHPELFRIYKTSKKYYPERNIEIFNMISTGAAVTNQSWYETLSKLC